MKSYYISTIFYLFIYIPICVYSFEPIDEDSPFLDKFIYHEINIDTGTVSPPYPTEISIYDFGLPQSSNLWRYPIMTDDGKTIFIGNSILKEIDKTFELVNLGSQKYNNRTIQITPPVIDETSTLLLFDNYAKAYNNITIYDLEQDKIILEYTNPILNLNSDERKLIDPLTASSDFKYVSFINQNIQYILERTNDTYEVISKIEIPSYIFWVDQVIMNASGTNLFGWGYTRKNNNNWINSKNPYTQLPIFNGANVEIIDYVNDNKTLLCASLNQLYIIKNTINGLEVELISPHNPSFKIQPYACQISNDSNVLMIQGITVFNSWDLYLYIRTPVGTWQYTKINAQGVGAGGPILSKDGKRLYWGPVIPVSVKDYHIHKY